MTDATRARVEAAALIAAATFVAESGRAYDDAQDGDWDGEAYAFAGEPGGPLESLTADETEEAWPVYRAAFLAETRRLAELEGPVPVDFPPNEHPARYGAS